jgi:hypothetical protein
MRAIFVFSGNDVATLLGLGESNRIVAVEEIL